MTDRTFAAALAAAPLVLDGGLGTLLEARGHDLSSALWSARLLLDDPDAIRAAHAAFAQAGAQVAITASYQVSYDMLFAHGLTRLDVDRLLARSVELARAGALDGGQDATWVAASVGPYGASRADGSEYTGDYGLTVAELRAWHRPRLHALAEAGADLLAVETIPSLAEVEAVTAELDGLGMPAWISMTVADGALRSGDPLADAARTAASAREVVAVGVNCCSAQDAADAVRRTAEVTGLPGVVYPNSGEEWDARARRWRGHGEPPDTHVAEWLDAGARLIGGCCRVGVAQISAISTALRGQPPAAALTPGGVGPRSAPARPSSAGRRTPLPEHSPPGYRGATSRAQGVHGSQGW